MIRRIVSSISAGISGPQESQNNAPHFPLLFPYLALSMPGRFYKLSEGECHGLQIEEPGGLQSVGSQRIGHD